MSLSIFKYVHRSLIFSTLFFALGDNKEHEEMLMRFIFLRKVAYSSRILSYDPLLRVIRVARYN